MQRSGASSQFASRIPAEVITGNMREVDFGEAGCSPLIRRLGFLVDLIDEHTQPLLTRAVCIN